MKYLLIIHHNSLFYVNYEYANFCLTNKDFIIMVYSY